MRDLAVLLVGLTAALAEQGDSAADNFQKGDVRRAVEWLKAHSAGNPDGARLKAAESFRKRLQEMAEPASVATSHLVVDPGYHAKLLNACAELAKLPPDTIVSGHPLLQENGVMVYINGNADCFSVEGLFPDVDGGLRASDFCLSPQMELSARRRDEKRPNVKDEDAWKYDGVEQRRPSVGDYLMTLGRWGELYALAKDFADKDFSERNVQNTRTLVDMFPAGQRDIGANVLRVVALAFGIVCLHKTAHEDWCGRWTEKVWVPWEMYADEDVLNNPLEKARLEESLAAIAARSNRTIDAVKRCFQRASKPRSLREWLVDLVEVIRSCSEGTNSGDRGTSGGADEGAVSDRLEAKGWINVRADWHVLSRDIQNVEDIQRLLGSAQKQFQKRVADEPQDAGNAPIQLTDGEKRTRVLCELGKRLVTLEQSWEETLNSSGGWEQKKYLSELLTNLIREPGLFPNPTSGSFGDPQRINRMWLGTIAGQALRESGLLSAWLCAHIALLERLGCIESRGDGTGVRRLHVVGSGEVLSPAPRQPRAFAPPWLTDDGLARSTGYDKWDSAKIERHEKAAGLPEGTIRKLANGDGECPPWLVGLCIHFAEDIEWSDEIGWPSFMRSGDVYS